MKFSVSMPGLTLFQGLGGQPEWATDISTEEIVAIARRADELRYDYMSVPWHLVMRLGEPASNFGARWPHSLSASGFLLGATTRMKIQTLLAVPCEPPVAMAKALATLDWLSGGRSVPTLLTGYLEWEFEFLGVPYEERGAIMDEHVAAMIELWTADEPRFDGKYVQFANIAFEPKPRQNPLPLWFGGRTKAALGRIARYGSGWMSYATPHREMRDAIAYIESRPDFAAHPRTLEVSAYFVEATHDPVTHAERGGRKIIVGNDHVLTQLQYLTSIGVDVTGAPLDAMADAGGRRRPIASVTDYLERLAWFAEEIMPHARPLVAERS